MTSHLFNHRCQKCGKTYLSQDKERIFCASSCEASFQKNGENKRLAKSEGERIDERRIHSKKGYQKRKLAKESMPKKEKKYTDLKSIMYNDTFKPALSNRLKVMRG